MLPYTNIQTNFLPTSGGALPCLRVDLLTNIKKNTYGSLQKGKKLLHKTILDSIHWLFQRRYQLQAKDTQFIFRRVLSIESRIYRDLAWYACLKLSKFRHALDDMAHCPAIYQLNSLTFLLMFLFLLQLTVMSHVACTVLPCPLLYCPVGLLATYKLTKHQIRVIDGEIRSHTASWITEGQQKRDEAEARRKTGVEMQRIRGVEARGKVSCWWNCKLSWSFWLFISVFYRLIE